MATYLPELLKRQRIMNAAAARWDEGRNADEVVIMALALRTLLGSGDQLINRVMPVKRGVMFLDSTGDQPSMPDGARMGVGGLSIIRLTDDPEDSGIRPLLTIEGHDPQTFVRYHEYWERQRPVIYNDLRVSRSFLVHEVANTDGIHIGRTLDADYDQLTKPLRNVTISHGGGPGVPADGVVAACMRQIVWEVDRTLSVELASRSLT